MRPQEQKPRKTFRRQDYKIYLSEDQYEAIMLRMPKNYALVEAKQWAQYAGKDQQQSMKEQRVEKPVSAPQRSKEVVEIVDDSVPVIQSSPTINIEGGKSKPPVAKPSFQIKRQHSEHRKSKDKPHKSSLDPNASQSEIITHLFSRITNHPEFAIIMQAKMQPTAQRQLEVIKSKFGQDYELAMFKEDINQMFQSFYKANGPNKRISLFFDLAMGNINKYSKKVAQSEEIKAKNSQRLEQKQVDTKKQKPRELQIPKEIQKPKELQKLKEAYIPMEVQKPKEEIQKPRIIQAMAIQKPRQLSAQVKIQRARKQSVHLKERLSHYQQPLSQQSEPSDQNIKSRLRRDISEPQKSQITLNAMATLGFNIRKLTSEGLKWICINFITGPKDRSLLKNSTFNLDLEALSSEQFWKLENFVKKKLEFAGVRYEKLPPEEDDDFVIEDDSEDSDED